MKRINLFLVALFIWSCVATYGRSIPDKKGTIVFYTEKSNTSKTGEVKKYMVPLSKQNFALPIFLFLNVKLFTE